MLNIMARLTTWLFTNIYISSIFTPNWISLFYQYSMSDIYMVSECPEQYMPRLRMCFLPCASSQWTIPCHHTAATSVSPECSAGIRVVFGPSEPKLHPHFLPLSSCPFPAHLPWVSISSSGGVTIECWHPHQRWDSKGDSWQSIQNNAVVKVRWTLSREDLGKSLVPPRKE